jgi:hypothetical protein
VIFIFLVDVVVKASMFYLVNLIITVNSTYRSKDVRVISPKILNFCCSFVPVCPHVMMDFFKFNVGLIEGSIFVLAEMVSADKRMLTVSCTHYM